MSCAHSPLIGLQWIHTNPVPLIKELFFIAITIASQASSCSDVIDANNLYSILSFLPSLNTEKSLIAPLEDNFVEIMHT